MRSLLQRVTNIRLRPSPRVDIRAARSSEHRPFGWGQALIDMNQRVRNAAKRTAPALLMIIGVASSAGTQAQSCTDYVGKPVIPTTLEAAITMLSRLPAGKSEYETTAAYNARMEQARRSLPSQLIIPTSIQRNSISYNADSQILSVDKYVGLPYPSARYDDAKTRSGDTLANLLGTASGYSFENKSLVLTYSAVKTGSYTASNAFGVSARVTQYAETTTAIFSGVEPRPYSSGQLPEIDSYVRLKASPAEAKAARMTIRSAIVIDPKPPFYVAGNIDPVTPTLEGRTLYSPRKLRVLVGDIRCTLYMKGDGTVIAATGTAKGDRVYQLSNPFSPSNQNVPAPTRLPVSISAPVVSKPVQASPSPPVKRINPPGSPIPILGSGPWVMTEDWPSAALREGREGIAAYALDVGIDGLPIACSITTSSGHEDLDERTCTLLMRRARFEPAKDVKGNPMRSVFTGRMRWGIP